MGIFASLLLALVSPLFGLGETVSLGKADILGWYLTRVYNVNSLSFWLWLGALIVIIVWLLRLEIAGGNIVTRVASVLLVAVSFFMRLFTNGISNWLAASYGTNWLGFLGVLILTAVWILISCFMALFLFLHMGESYAGRIEKKPVSEDKFGIQDYIGLVIVVVVLVV